MTRLAGYTQLDLLYEQLQQHSVLYKYKFK